MFKNKNGDANANGEDYKLPSDDKSDFLEKSADRENWLGDDYEGELSVDVYQTAKEIVIKSTIAGIKPEDVDIAINNDMVTIRGARKQESEMVESDYLFQECYWGGFSRSIILPQPIRADKARADLENGILTIRLPMLPQVNKVSVKVKSLKKAKKERVDIGM